MPATLLYVIIAAGLFNLGMAVFHLAFWRVFRWNDDLPRLRPVNRAIVQVLNLCLTFLLAFFACVLLAFPSEVVMTALGRFLLLGLSAFWLVRAIYQPMFFGMKHPASVGFLAIFLAGSVLHGAAWYLARG